MDVLPVTSDNKHLLAGLAEAISGWKGRGWLVDSGGYNPCRTQDNAALDQAIVHSADDLRNRRAFSHNLSDRTVVDGKMYPKTASTVARIGVLRRSAGMIG